MLPKSGGEPQFDPALKPATEASPNALLSDDVVSGAFLGQAASQALGAAFSQAGFTLDGTDNQHHASPQDHE